MMIYRMMDEVNEEMVNMMTLITIKKGKLGLRMSMSLSRDQRAKIAISTTNETAVLSGLSLMAYTDSKTDITSEKRFSAITISKLFESVKDIFSIHVRLLIPAGSFMEGQN